MQHVHWIGTAIAGVPFGAAMVAVYVSRLEFYFVRGTIAHARVDSDLGQQLHYRHLSTLYCLGSCCKNLPSIPGRRDCSTMGESDVCRYDTSVGVNATSDLGYPSHANSIRILLCKFELTYLNTMS
jgi:hypothetical protein